MSKTSADRNFRKVDIDELDEDRFQDDQTEAAANAFDDSEIQKLILSKDNAGALKALIAAAPIGANKDVKDKAFTVAMRVLTAFKSSEVEAAIKALPKPQVDTLVKYIYRGFAEPADSNCAILLTWHEKAVAVGGLGCIVRAMTDRQSI